MEPAAPKCPERYQVVLGGGGGFTSCSSFRRRLGEVNSICQVSAQHRTPLKIAHRWNLEKPFWKSFRKSMRYRKSKVVQNMRKLLFKNQVTLVQALTSSLNRANKKHRYARDRCLANWIRNSQFLIRSCWRQKARIDCSQNPLPSSWLRLSSINHQWIKFTDVVVGIRKNFTIWRHTLWRRQSDKEA